MSMVEQPFADVDLAELGRLRATIVDALGAYQSFVHREIYAPAAAGRDHAARHNAQALKISCIQLNADYERFRGRWSHRDVADHWPEYRLSARKMARQIAEHTDRAAHLFAAQCNFSSGTTGSGSGATGTPSSIRPRASSSVA